MHPYYYERLGDIIDYSAGFRWTGVQLKREIAARTASLVDRNVTANDNVIIIHGNSAHFFADLIAIWNVGACAVCLDSDVGSTEFETVLRVCAARHVITAGGMPSKLAEVDTRGIDVIDTYQLSARVGTSISTNIPSGPTSIDDSALILFTSGTTGDPKGVVHTFRTLLAKWAILPNHVPLEHLGVSLCLLPTHFGHGLICNCLYPLLNGKTLLILPRFSAATLAKLGSIIDEHQVSYMSSVPAVWMAATAISKPPAGSTIRLVTCGSAPLGEGLWSQIQTWTGTNRVWNTYGITEMGSWIAGTSVDVVTPQDGLIGPGWGTRILVTAHHGDAAQARLSAEDAVAPGEAGYVWLQSPMMMQSYYKRPDLTAAVIHGTWFYTGDIGYLTEDRSLVLSGRERSEINFAGIKVMPEDVDLILQRHEAVFEACTFGLNDSLAGEVVATAIVLKPGASKPTSAEMKKWASQYLSNYKVPSIWFTIDEIPKSPRGKVIRSQVADYCLTQSRLK